MKNVVVILAGGQGTRFGCEKPKQFIKVAGKMVIEHTVEAFQKNSNIDEIIIVSHKDYLMTIKEMVISNRYTKVKKILNGGKERYDSSLVAINAYLEQEDINLLFHDAVRPMLDNNIINNVIEALKKYNAVDVAVPATDTIIQVKDSFIVDIPDRDSLRRGQTPQGFKLKTIKKAYEIALQDENFKSTDDCGIVKKYLPEEPIYVVKGSESNMKLTYEEDLFLLDKLFQLKSINVQKNEKKILNKLNNKVLAVFGGSYGIGKEIINSAQKYGAKTYSFSRSETNTDISDVKQVKEALEKVVKLENRIDYIVNTAGVLHKEPLVHMDYSTIESSINVNYMGNIILAKESFEYLKESQGGLLLFTSSSYTRGRAMYSIYSSLKAATVNLVQALSSEWEVFGVKVNCINPERTLTPMRVKNFGQEDPSTLLTPEEVAIASLKTLLSNFTGQVVDVKLLSNKNDK